MPRSFGKKGPTTPRMRTPGRSRGAARAPSRPRAPWRAGTRAAPDDAGVVVSIGPVNESQRWLKSWMTFPVTPESIPVAVSAAWQETQIVGRTGGEFSSFGGRNLDTITFSGRLEPPLFYTTSSQRPPTPPPPPLRVEPGTPAQGSVRFSGPAGTVIPAGATVSGSGITFTTLSQATLTGQSIVSPGVRATGTVRFTGTGPASRGVVIPLGTVLRAGTVEFETTSPVQIPEAEPYVVSVAAKARLDGPAGDVGAGAITTIYAPSGIPATVTNPAPFTGGTNAVYGPPVIDVPVRATTEGVVGNLPAGALNTTSVAGVTVTNPSPTAGGTNAGTSRGAGGQRLDPVLFGGLDEAATARHALNVDSDSALTGEGVPSAEFPSLDTNQRVVMDRNARAGPNDYYEPHTFKEIVTKIVKHGEVVKLVVGDAFGWSGLATIRDFTWRYEDPDPDVLLFDITFRQHRERTLAGVTGRIKKKPKAKTYTTQRQDTLYSIAVEQLGDSDDWKTLRKLNADVLKKLWIWPGSPELAHKVRDKKATPAPKNWPPHLMFAEGIKLKLRK